MIVTGAGRGGSTRASAATRFLTRIDVVVKMRSCREVVGLSWQKNSFAFCAAPDAGVVVLAQFEAAASRITWRRST
jgi:hypothetical protein